MNALLQADLWDVTLRGLHRAAGARPRRRPYQPRPRGVPIGGSTSAAVVALMRARPGRWWSESDLLAELPGRSRGAVTSSLAWMRERGLLATRPAGRPGALDRYVVHRLAGACHE